MLERQIAQDKSERIYAAFMECLTEGTYESISIRKIAEKAGITYSSLYYYFRDKEDILLSYFDHYSVMIETEMRSVLENLTEEERNGITLPQLTSLLLKKASTFHNERANCRVEVNFATLAMRNENLAKKYGEFTQRQIDLFQWAIEFCGIRTSNPRIAAWLINQQVLGYVMHYAIFSEEAPPDQLLALYDASFC